MALSTFVLQEAPRGNGVPSSRFVGPFFGPRSNGRKAMPHPALPPLDKLDPVQAWQPWQPTAFGDILQAGLKHCP